jgi:hypothetical protein
LLGLNTRVTHFNANISRASTFCNIKGINPAPAENFLHLFYDCPEINKVLNLFVTNQVPEPNLISDSEKKKFFFLGHHKSTDTFDNLFITIKALKFDMFFMKNNFFLQIFLR